MDDFMAAVQGGSYSQSQVFGSTVQALKLLVHSLLYEAKDLVVNKKLWSLEGDWTCAKELLEWTVDMEEGTVSLPDIKHQDLLELFNITALKHHMVRKDL